MHIGERAKDVPEFGERLSRGETRLLQGLRRRKVREEQGLFLGEGVRLVEEVVRCGVRIRLAAVSPELDRTERGARLMAEMEGACPVRRVSPAELAGVAATRTPQGVVVAAEIPRHDLASIELAETAPVLVLDGIQDPGNLGVLVRTAEALGVGLVAALPGTVDPWNPKAVRASAGAALHVPVVSTTLETLARWLEEKGFRLLGADAGGLPVARIQATGRVALVVGNEGEGLSREVADAVDALVAIPIEGRAESLNVAVAAGILLYLLGR